MIQRILFDKVFEIAIIKKWIGSLTDICKENGYHHLQSYDKIQLIHIILNQEYRDDYDDFINLN